MKVGRHPSKSRGHNRHVRHLRHCALAFQGVGVTESN
jgi:hypothetical protein